jgi:hypothetical protein
MKLVQSKQIKLNQALQASYPFSTSLKGNAVTQVRLMLPWRGDMVLMFS